MKHGTSHRPRQYPPKWKGTSRVKNHPPPLRQRRKRNSSIGWNPLYEYSLGINLVMLTGRVTREPRVAGFKHHEMTWFRISVPNQDNPGQKLFISVRCRGALAHHAFENVAKGDDVAVVGRIWSMRMFKPTERGGQPIWRQVIYLDAERVSGSYPVQLDYDSRYIKIRIDLWNRMCRLVPEMAEDQIPARERRELYDLWDQAAEWYAECHDEVADDMGDPDPSTDKEPPDEPCDS